MDNKTKRLKVLQDEWRDCIKCKLHTLRNQVVFGVGNPEAKLVFVGEAPGEDEDLGGEPFIGRAGKLFDKILEAVNINREDIWITNTCLCRPKTEVENRSNRAPNKKEINACRPRLQEEMRIISPRVVVLAGNTPLYMATTLKGITKHRGWVIKPNKNKPNRTAIYATLHPASMLYGSAEQIKQKKRWAWEDWQEIAKVYHETE